MEGERREGEREGGGKKGEGEGRERGERERERFCLSVKPLVKPATFTCHTRHLQANFTLEFYPFHWVCAY